jgi:hypothetical protein
MNAGFLYCQHTFLKSNSTRLGEGMVEFSTTSWEPINQKNVYSSDCRALLSHIVNIIFLPSEIELVENKSEIEKFVTCRFATLVIIRTLP